MEHLNMESNYYNSQIHKIICREKQINIHFQYLGHMKICSKNAGNIKYGDNNTKK
jgi:hypothetical protein